MKYTIILLLFSCAAWGQKGLEIDLKKMDHYDSAHFKITRVYYISGQICLESYTDTIRKLRYERRYYLGKLEEEGNLDDERNFHVGVWKFYSKKGRLKKISFDSTSQTSYHQAIQIAKSYGYNGEGIEIKEEFIKNKYYWEIEYWKEKVCNPCIGEYILIKRKNGKVTKPKNNKLTRFD
ncbi:MAG TPA: hypothetical protein VF411_10530 [Bacteroidia bacterium]